MASMFLVSCNLLRNSVQYFGLSYLIIHLVLQNNFPILFKKTTTAIVYALSAIQPAKKYFERINSEEEFDRLYINTEQFVKENSEKPVLSRRRKEV